jgi:hypothetical protein
VSFTARPKVETSHDTGTRHTVGGSGDHAGSPRRLEITWWTSIHDCQRLASLRLGQGDGDGRRDKQVTIKTSKGTTKYSVTSSSDIDKSGEAALSSLAVGDTVRFSVDGSNSLQIDKLHAGDEAKNGPQGNAGATSFNGA